MSHLAAIAQKIALRDGISAPLLESKAFKEWTKDKAKNLSEDLSKILETGSKKANKIASKKLEEIKEKVGLII